MFFVLMFGLRLPPRVVRVCCPLLPRKSCPPASYIALAWLASVWQLLVFLFHLSRSVYFYIAGFWATADKKRTVVLLLLPV